MAIRLVRKPSETPNIENTDDFVGLRYSYANQNGYVIGRGRFGKNEPYTINGNNFIVNSGRFVLQGVEVDVQNGHTITIDLNGSKQYYTIFLEVNLDEDTAKIDLIKDGLQIPMIDPMDDLTINPIGTARMPLFTFEATNGVISNVKQVVKACNYSLPVEIDSNGVMTSSFGTIPYNRILWKGTPNSDGTYQIPRSIWNRHIRIKMAYTNSIFYTDMYVEKEDESDTDYAFKRVDRRAYFSSQHTKYCDVMLNFLYSDKLNGRTMTIDCAYISSGDDTITAHKIPVKVYEIIEIIE